MFRVHNASSDYSKNYISISNIGYLQLVTAVFVVQIFLVQLGTTGLSTKENPSCQTTEMFPKQHQRFSGCTD